MEWRGTGIVHGCLVAGADAGFRVRGGRKWRIQDFSEGGA